MKTNAMQSNEIRSLADVLSCLQQGHQPDYLFFWGHRPSTGGGVGKSCLSQWFEASFELDSISYPTAEHFMMAGKARLFADQQACERILLAPTPDAAKKLGRQIRGFDEARWNAARFDIVVRGNIAKFSQNQALRGFLLATADKVLVEASPVDPVWGIGLAADDPRARDPKAWGGLNLLGFALMAARHQIRSTK